MQEQVQRMMRSAVRNELIRSYIASRVVRYRRRMTASGRVHRYGMQGIPA